MALARLSQVCIAQEATAIAGWLSDAIALFLVETISRFGLPPEPITIRNQEFAQANATAPMGAPAVATSAP
jgi:hypothetical protein